MRCSARPDAAIVWGEDGGGGEELQCPSRPRARTHSIKDKTAVILRKGHVGIGCGEVLSVMKMNVRYLERSSNNDDGGNVAAARRWIN